MHRYKLVIILGGKHDIMEEVRILALEYKSRIQSQTHYLIAETTQRTWVVPSSLH